MIPPTTNELRQHSDRLSNLGKNLHNLNGRGRRLTDACVIAVALVAVLVFLTPVFAEIV